MPEHETATRGQTAAGYETAELNPHAYADWDRLVQDGTHLHLFSLTNFADIYARHLDLAFSVHVVRDRQGTLAGGILLFTTLSNLRAAIVPPFVYYTPVLWFGDYAHLPRELNHHPAYALSAYLKARFEAAEIWLGPGDHDPRPFTWTGWQVSPRFTYTMQPGTVADFVASLPSKKRSKFRFDRTRVDFETSDEVPGQMLNLLEKSFARHQETLPIPKETLKNILGDLTRAHLVRTYTLKAAGEELLQAAIVVAASSKTALHWLPTSIPGKSMTTLLQLTQDALFRRGVTEYDLCGANTASIALFKQQFADRLAPCFVLRYNRSSLP